MQEILIDMVFLGFFALLLAAMSRSRSDDRLPCWVAGWLFVTAHFGIQLYQPVTALGRHVQACIAFDALALGALCFVVSTFIRQVGRAASLRVFVWLAVPTLACLTLAVLRVSTVLPLAAAVLVRQAVALTLTARIRRHRPAAALAVGSLCALTGSSMLFGVLNGQPAMVIFALMGEMFLTAAVGFRADGWHGSLGLKAVVGGFAAWGVFFPLSYWLVHLSPLLNMDREVWNVPRLCAVIGMAFVVLEGDSSAARALGEDYRLLFEAASSLGKDYRLLFESNPQAFWIVETATTRFLDANQAALDLHGYTREEFLQMKLPDVEYREFQDPGGTTRPPAELQPNRAAMHVRKDGSKLPLDLTVHDLVFHGKKCRFVMAIDVTEREKLKQLLDLQATHDPLTGLPNRISFLDLISTAIENALQTGEKIAVLSLDIDRFKRVNDLYGLRVGDEYIQRIAATLTARMRSMDIVARTGGDEFTIVLTGLKSSVTAEQTVNELMDVFAQSLIVEGYKVQFPVSIGVAMGPEDGVDPIALWRGAESACQRAKAAGGAKVVWLSPELNREAEQQIELEAYMRSHLNDGGFHLLYQPIYGLDGTVRGLEALLRLNHPTFGPVSPIRVIPIAEESGLIVPLGEWVIEEACRQILVWKSQGMRMVPVNVNVSGLQLAHMDFARRLTDTLERYAIEPGLIHLEITESVAMADTDQVTEQMSALLKRGVAFAIDDFGTGHSSLARLSQLGVAELKIDRSFLQPRSTKNAHSIVQAIITMGHALGRAVVAEGVETESQVACLRELDCDLLQGFLLSRPVAADKIPALTAAIHPVLAGAAAKAERTDIPHLVARAGD